jgi:hypothetical protein
VKDYGAENISNIKGLTGKFPAQKEQGIFQAEQGIFWESARIFGSEHGISPARPR